jgi:hypothetical protein
MSGAHRSTTASRAASARKSAVWLLQLAALATVLLPVLGLACLVGYLIVANPAVPGWLLPVGIVLLSAAWIWVLGDIAWSLRREPRRWPAFWVRMVGRVLPLVAGAILMLTDAGQPHGWTHGPAKSVLTWCACLLMAANACWLASERLLVAGMTARAASRQEPLV